MVVRNSNIPKSALDIISQSNHPFLSKFEIDTVRMSINRNQLSEETFNNIINKFNAKKVNSYLWKGKYKGFIILVNDFSLVIIGSFSNYITQLNTLPYKKLEATVERLSLELGINLHYARIYRIDINWNYITKLLVNKYTYNLFTDLSRFKRLERDFGVLFKTKVKAIEFYNRSKKLEELKLGNIENWFRIEFRIMKNVKKILGIKYVKDLYNPTNYLKLLKLFKEHYFKIKRQVSAIDNIQSLASLKTYKELLMLKGIISNGGLSSAYRDIEQLSVMGVFSNPNQKYRLRKQLDLLVRNEQITKPHDLVSELDNQFLIDYNEEISKYNFT